MKKSHRPVTKIKNPEPNQASLDWVIWAAWADRITFEDIKKKNWKGGPTTPQKNNYSFVRLVILVHGAKAKN